MRQILAACRAACWLFSFVSLARAAGAQQWNDTVTLKLVDRAVTRRTQTIADTGLVDYRATAHGTVTFLAQLGEGFPAPPKIVKADELELEVYWHSPNQSKQRIIGRRDTLLLPTDIAYHRDHLAIVQNNFGPVIRIGDGDEVRDVPHPLSTIGFPLYDFALSDSFAIGSGAQRIRVYELKVRPKDDRQPRIVGALYLDQANAEVVRMNVTFTRSALLDKALEDVSVVLENRLVGGRFWLPNRQEIEIRRNGEWLDYPIRGIIRGKWEISDYQFNLDLAPSVFLGPEVVQLPAAELKRHSWTGNILDSLPPDVRAVSEPDIQRVQAEARELVRARALEQADNARLSARNISDFVRFNRVEGLALGGGVAKPFGAGMAINARARYGLDDNETKGSVLLSWTRASGSGFRIFGSRDFRDVGDVVERSTVVNSLAAQEFGSDYTDPYLVRALGAGADFVASSGLRTRFSASYEWQSALTVSASPVTGSYTQTLAVPDQHATRLSLELDRAPVLSFFGTELSGHAEARAVFPTRASRPEGMSPPLRLAAQIGIERPIGTSRLVTATSVAGLNASISDAANGAPQELVFLGGPISAPGYAYHSIATNAAVAERIEWRMAAPFVPFSLGRFGRVPARGTLAVYGHALVVNADQRVNINAPLLSGPLTSRCACQAAAKTFYPSVGVAYLLPFDVVRIDVARGLARGGRWTFNVDVSREFWPIL